MDKRKFRTDHRSSGTATKFARSYIQQSGGSCTRDQLHVAMQNDPAMASRIQDSRSFAQLIYNLKASGSVDGDRQTLWLVNECSPFDAAADPRHLQSRLRPDLNLAQLEAFYSAAKHRTLGEAAAQCGTTRQSLCMTLKRLEASAEKPLFLRAVRGTAQELTQAGHKLVILYEELLETISKIQSEFPGLARSRD